MAKFEFSKSKIKLEFPNCEFDIKITDTMHEDAVIYAQKAMLLDANVKDSANVEELRERKATVVAFCEESIDKLVGAGTVDKIFENEDKEFMAMVDVWAYVINEITKGIKTQGDKYDVARIGIK